jgi:hypothetical protein
MPTNSAEYHLLHEQRDDEGSTSQASLLTPARRAALEALEREFRDLLQARTAQAA